jgi:putative transposase
MTEYRKGAHTVYDIKYHFVWVTKYRYQVLQGEIAVRVRDIIREVCVSHEIRIIKGHVGRDHVHLFVSAPPRLAVSKIMQYIKGKSSHRVQQEYPSLRKRYWGRHIWARGYFCATAGSVTDKMIAAYIEQQEPPPDDDFEVADGGQLL